MCLLWGGGGGVSSFGYILGIKGLQWEIYQKLLGREESDFLKKKKKKKKKTADNKLGMHPFKVLDNISPINDKYM